MNHVIEEEASKLLLYLFLKLVAVLKTFSLKFFFQFLIFYLQHLLHKIRKLKFQLNNIKL